MRKFSEITWPSEYSELKRIEELLVCGICYDYMETSVMTPCSHNYCSLCIRKYLHYKNQCPACFQDTFEKDLHTNRILDEIILYFATIRNKLVTCISGAKRLPLDEPPAPSPPVRPARSNQIKSPEIRSKPETPPDDPPTPVLTPVKSFSSPSTSGTSKLTTFFTPKSRKPDRSITLVPCPVCRVEISELHINKHLDDCLKRDSQPERPPRVESKRKPLPKLVVCLMKDTELKKKMKLLNLSIRGDRKTLENRYHRYCTLYNAECDKVSPRSVEEVLKQCEEEEELERMSQEAKLNVSRLNITRNSNQHVIEAMQKQYLETNKDKYEDLIAQIKSRKAPKPPVRRSLINDSQNVKENGDEGAASEENSTSRPIFEDAFQDNDSDDSCLLQTYTSDHPMSFLCLGMSDESSSPKKMKKRSETLAVHNSMSNGVDSTRVPTPSIYDQTTDAETDDDQGDCMETSVVTPCSHNSAMPMEPNLKEDRRIIEERKSRGRILADAIVKDFCDDDSNEEEVKVEGKVTESGRGDKENDEGESIAARRPVRKRNHPSRFRDEGEKGQTSRLTPIDALREEINGNKLVVKGSDGTLKRRRRRKGDEGSEEPPRRPVRKREASNVVQGN
ncbi:E3 ubiquitin-protein ligase RAD18 [Diachasma alloeum]|uniref:E3 ubiquitin-protein ligase RAD18 n=1 Tax=Diachasma alloeum TaxID=454923 RepID=UPI00073827B3|nr:E3 ubiquitin-protein ligase RAD18 [Diachasma alloeum]